jgi:hypothetical protein
MAKVVTDLCSEVPHLHPGPEINYPESGFSSLPPGKY